MSISILAKPIGPLCNLNCHYCFYLDKHNLYPEQRNFRMTDQVLASYIKQYIQLQPSPVVGFAWQGGEPTLLGIDFFRKVVNLQKRYLPASWYCENSIQTNGTLIDQAWCDFLKAENFLVGISLDGPANLHNAFRQDKQGLPTYQQVVAGLKLLQKAGIDYNVLCTVNRENVAYPEQVYQHFRELGIRFIQFIPIVEFSNDSFSVSGTAYGKFLTSVFHQWLLQDLGRISVQIFEECFSIIAGFGPKLCSFHETCGQALVIEHNGDIYTCDHFVNQENYLGNILETELQEIVSNQGLQDFAANKKMLANHCNSCPVKFICNGGCPKNRQAGINHLCAGYQQFFSYALPYFQLLADLTQKRYPLDFITKEMRNLHEQRWSKVGRNDPCPCNSGKKYKKCCQDNKI